MPRFDPDGFSDFATQLFVAVGVPHGEAQLVADHLVEAGLRGHHTHGPLRLPQYVDMVRCGAVRPGAPLTALLDTPCAARVSGGWNFGPVPATAAVELAIGKAQSGAVAVVSVRDCSHVARLGRFAALAPARRMVALMMANGHGGDLAVAPHGGSERRLPTNPLSVALPTGRAWPLVLDMTTSVLSGGDLRLLRNLGQPAPPDALIDADGRSTTDPEAYYATPPGAILPLGYPDAGHKGFGLSMIVDVLAGALSGAGCSTAEPVRPGNALFIAVLRVEAFTGWETYLAEVDGLLTRLSNCPPAAGVDRVRVPGEHAHEEYERGRRHGVRVDDSAWCQITSLAAELGVAPPTPVESP